MFRKFYSKRYIFRGVEYTNKARALAALVTIGLLLSSLYVVGIMLAGLLVVVRLGSKPAA